MLLLDFMLVLDGWEWKDGSAADYFKWSEGEPNGAIGTEECVEMYPWDGTWNDIDCYEDKGFICKTRRGSIILLFAVCVVENKS